MPVAVGVGVGVCWGQLLVKSKLLAPTIAVVTPLTNPPLVQHRAGDGRPFGNAGR